MNWYQLILLPFPQWSQSTNNLILKDFMIEKKHTKQSAEMN